MIPTLLLAVVIAPGPRIEPPPIILPGPRTVAVAAPIIRQPPVRYEIPCPT